MAPPISASAAAALSDDDLNSLAEKIGQDARKKFGSVGKAFKTMQTDNRCGIPRTEVRKMLAGCGYGTAIADRLFDSLDYAEDGVVNTKDLQRKLDSRRPQQRAPGVLSLDARQEQQDRGSVRSGVSGGSDGCSSSRCSSTRRPWRGAGGSGGTPGQSRSTTPRAAKQEQQDGGSERSGGSGGSDGRSSGGSGGSRGQSRSTTPRGQPTPQAAKQEQQDGGSVRSGGSGGSDGRYSGGSGGSRGQSGSTTPREQPTPRAAKQVSIEERRASQDTTQPSSTAGGDDVSPLTTPRSGTAATPRSGGGTPRLNLQESRSAPQLAPSTPATVSYAQFDRECQMIGIAAARRHGCAMKALRSVQRSKDDRVTRKEVQRFYNTYGYEKEVADRFFDYLDQDGRGSVPWRLFRAHFAPQINPYHNQYKKDAEELVTPRYLVSAKKSPQNFHNDEAIRRLPGELPRVVDKISLAASMKHRTVWQATRCVKPSVEGTISRDQVRTFFRNYGFPSTDLADKFYDRLDHVADGTVPFSDFQQYFGRSFDHHKGYIFDGQTISQSFYSTPSRGLVYDPLN